ncbi:DUF3280 domain-containing protein [Denitrobaculum tricleocarpae]|uniref:DUF2380 domain-containing protein n=1 Tax=Denitrobaculum tricleocarpae TaxID=2591009 RepID=A0A545U0Y8_9PROT|nr:DUF3280 domain-containing protein [Denitrobaculum tricleocarpae]TQV83118.1 DUF2380 domain-containing protein [Denitrobaculum tricleocarpae]
MRIFFVSALALLLCLAAPLRAEPEKSRAAIFDFELIDTSLEGAVKGINQNESKRLILISDILREKLSDSGLYEIADLSHLKAKIDDAGYLHSCNGCEVKLAAEADAQLAITGVVQKVSNLILNINVYMRDVQSGEMIRSASADIRGNTDQSWSHGISWLARNRLLKP